MRIKLYKKKFFCKKNVIVYILRNNSLNLAAELMLLFKKRFAFIFQNLLKNGFSLNTQF